MAARTMRTRHQDDVRAKIQASQLINVLQNHALGDTAEMPASRLKAIEILLRKSLPDLSAVELNGPGENGEHLFGQIVRKVVDAQDADD